MARNPTVGWGPQRMRRLDGISNSMDMSLSAQTKRWAEGIRVPAPLPGRGSTTAILLHVGFL